MHDGGRRGFQPDAVANGMSGVVQAATYNVNGRKPPPGLDLAAWLGGAREADVVVVGFQEIVPLNASNVMNGGRVQLAPICLIRHVFTCPLHDLALQRAACSRHLDASLSTALRACMLGAFLRLSPT